MAQLDENEMKKTFHQKLRQQQRAKTILAVIGIFFAYFGIQFFLAPFPVYKWLSAFGADIDPKYIVIVGATLAFYGAAIFAYIYLRGGLDPLEAIRALINRTQEIRYTPEEFERAFKKTYVNDNQIKSFSWTFSDADNYRSGEPESAAAVFRTLKKRMVDEIERIDRKASFNLAAGSFLALVGIAILGFHMYRLEIAEQVGQKLTDLKNQSEGFLFVREFAPKLSLVLLVEGLSFFFLALYKSAQVERRYYHNELSNIEFRNLALLVSNGKAKDLMTKNIVSGFLGTDRNRGANIFENGTLESKLPLGSVVKGVTEVVLRKGGK